MKKIIALFMLSFFVFSSCSSVLGPGPKNDPLEIPVIGYGLELDLRLDSRYVAQNKIIYELDLKNSGYKDVVLSQSDFKFYTVETYTGFSASSIEEFYLKIFSDSSDLILVNSQEKKVSGIFEIDESFKNHSLDSLSYILDANYEYETIFDNNLEFVYNNGIFELRKLDKISQAAPLQISDIKLVPDVQKDQYVLEYYFDDRGGAYFALDDTQVKIDSIRIQLGTMDITSDCKGIEKEGAKKIKEVLMSELLVKRNSNLIVECKIILDKKESFTTKTLGNFNYEYKIKKKGMISVPRD